MITRVAYDGWQNNVKLSNDHIELIATLDVGPRIIRFGAPGGLNVMKEYADQLGKSGEETWQIRGGHRFWHAPEEKPRTYALDNSPVQITEVDEFSVRLTPAEETANGIQKEIEITITADDNRVLIRHRMTNTGPWAIELAPWALSVMAPGGTCIVPLPEKRPHTEVLTPDFPLVLWPYTDLRDSRLQLGTRYICLSQDVTKGPTKYGMTNVLGWAGYLLQDNLFVKYFDYDPLAPYPDYNCNFETFTNEDMLEVESLGPMVLLEPGETIEHDETWRLFTGLPAVRTEDDIDRVISPLVDEL